MQIQEKKSCSEDQENCKKESPKVVVDTISNCCGAQEIRLTGIDFLKRSIKDLTYRCQKHDQEARTCILRAGNLQALLDSLPSKLNSQASEGLIFLVRQGPLL